MAWNDPKTKSEVEEQLEWPGEVVSVILVMFFLIVSAVAIKLINRL